MVVSCIMPFLKIGHVATHLLLSCSVLRMGSVCAQRNRGHTQGQTYQNIDSTVDQKQGWLSPAGRNSLNQLIPVRELDIFEVDKVDIEQVAAEDEQAEREALEEGILLPFRFAIPNDVSVTPQTHGLWESSDDGTKKIWRFRTRSRDAVSLNLGFERFVMPPGGVLYLYDPYSRETIRSYSDGDNADHRELWTAILRSEEAILEVNLPKDIPNTVLELHLTKINVGYRGPAPDVTVLPLRPRPTLSNPRRVGQPAGTRSLSGSCNVDVKCTEGDSWGDQIRSVAVYSKLGQLTCTGFMVNNANQDGTPFFMTAHHCDVTDGNAASVVVYWNFETQTCGGLADENNPNSTTHNLDPYQSQSGATLRATYAVSDMTLLELNDIPDPAWGVTYAGWDATEINSFNGAVAIHHPNVEEKRISFEYDPTTITSYFGTDEPGDGTHIRVIDWDVGTTEGGSSGSPLFDPSTNRVVGQLHGGSARCWNNESDWYGRFSVSWTGGGSDHARLSNWLDPRATGMMFVDTYDPSIPLPRVSCTPSIGSIAWGEAAHSTCVLSSQGGFAGNVSLYTVGNPSSIVSIFSPSNVSVPSGGYATSELTISVGENVSTVSYPGYNFDVEAAYNQSNSEKAGMSVIVTQSWDGNATYDWTVGAPVCWTVGPSCDSNELLKGRGGMDGGGAEVHTPNTIDGCADGGVGFYGNDESIERIVVRTVGGGDIAEGTEVEVEASVYPFYDGQDDYADFYYASDATDPVWVYIGTLQPPNCVNCGVQVLTQNYTLPVGSLQAVRVNFRIKGEVDDTACSRGLYDGNYDEADDLAFSVAPSPTNAPTATPYPTPNPTTENPTAIPTSQSPTAIPTSQSPTANPTTSNPTTPKPTLTPTTASPTTRSPTANPTTPHPTPIPTTPDPTPAQQALPTHALSTFRCFIKDSNRLRVKVRCSVNQEGLPVTVSWSSSSAGGGPSSGNVTMTTNKRGIAWRWVADGLDGSAPITVSADLVTIDGVDHLPTYEGGDAILTSCEAI